MMTVLKALLSGLPFKVFVVAVFFVGGLMLGLEYKANEHKAAIAKLERDHATELAEQLSLESELLADSVAQQQQREKSYNQALQLLNQQLYEQRQQTALKLAQLNELEKQNEEVKRVGAMPTPNTIVEWLR